MDFTELRKLLLELLHYDFLGKAHFFGTPPGLKEIRW
jgi:hypothetical protein